MECWELQKFLRIDEILRKHYVEPAGRSLGTIMWRILLPVGKSSDLRSSSSLDISIRIFCALPVSSNDFWKFYGQ